jgi:hypothetical protein
MGSISPGKELSVETNFNSFVSSLQKFLMNQALPLRAKRRVMEAVTDFSFLRLRHPRIMIHPLAYLIQSQTHVDPDNPESPMAATFVPVGGSLEQPHRGVSLPDTLSEIGHMIHSLALLGSRYNSYNIFFDKDEFIRRVFFRFRRTGTPA